VELFSLKESPAYRRNRSPNLLERPMDQSLGYFIAIYLLSTSPTVRRIDTGRFTRPHFSFKSITDRIPSFDFFNLLLFYNSSCCLLSLDPILQQILRSPLIQYLRIIRTTPILFSLYNPTIIEHDSPNNVASGSPMFILFNQLPIEIRLHI
jgi:hypothetical protein